MSVETFTDETPGDEPSDPAVEAALRDKHRLYQKSRQRAMVDVIRAHPDEFAQRWHFHKHDLGLRHVHGPLDGLDHDWLLRRNGAA